MTTFPSTALLKTLAAALLLGASAAPALADGFSGTYAPANWSLGNVGTLLGSSPSNGTAVFNAGATTLTMNGSNTASAGCMGGVYATLSASPCQIQATIGHSGVYSFSWSYLTSDLDGPAGDVFGVIVDGQRIQLSDPGGDVVQGGVTQFTAQSSFGYFLNCTDCTGGAASVAVSDFVAAAVPEPASPALMLAGVAALAAWRRLRRRDRG